ncbi:MAG: hypothetical protein IK093_09505 [Ruminiclostridium sp.]|nr:hypothetical protein [Ruminiclostridium sp.]
MKHGIRLLAAALAASAAISCMSVTSFADKLRIIDGITYRVSNDGKKIGKYNGWSAGKSGTKYYYRDGVKMKNTWLKENGIRVYYMDDDGKMTVGNAEIGGAQYYFSANGRLVYGIEAKGSAIKSTGMKLSLNGVALGSDNVEVWTGDDYTIEYKKSSGKWAKQSYITDAVSWNDEALLFFNGGRLVERTDELNWESLYGSLPTGDYRLCKECYVRLTPDSKPLTRKLYVPFTVKVYEDAESAWGVSMTASDVSTEGLTLTVSRSGPDDGDVHYFADYVLEVTDETGSWEEVNRKARRNTVFPDKYNSLVPGRNNTESISFYTGTLSPGHYRIKRRLTGDSGGVKGSLYACAEFDITDATPNGWGLSMSCGNDACEDGVTLTVRHDEPVMNIREVWSNEAYAVERYVKGKWEALEPTDDNFAWSDTNKVIAVGNSKTVALNWERIYGLLPEGKYRIAKTFYSSFANKPSRTVSNTLYAEFTVDKDGVNIGQYDPGMTAVSGTKTSLALRFARSGKYAGTVAWNGCYEIHRKASNGKWTLYKGKSAMDVSGCESRYIPDGRKTDITVDLSSVYPTLTRGTYRIKMKLTDGTGHSRYCYATFVVK